MVPGPSNTSNIFGNQKFSETRKSFPTNFSVVWDNTFSTTNRDPPPYPRNISIPENFWNTERFPLRRFPAFLDKKYSMESFDTPHFLSRNFFATALFLKHSTGRFPYEIIDTVKQRFFGGKSWYPPFIFTNLLASDNFPKHSTGLFAYDVIRYCDTKNFRHKIVILLSSHPSYPKISSISEFFETQKGSPTKAFGTVRQQFFCWKLWYPLLGTKFFDTRNFLKHRNVPFPKVSSTVRQKNYRKVLILLTSYPKKFSLPEKFW